jgi:hypothetical protein
LQQYDAPIKQHPNPRRRPLAAAQPNPQDIDAPLRIAAQRRSLPIGNNTLTIRTFLFFPAIVRFLFCE